MRRHCRGARALLKITGLKLGLPRSAEVAEWQTQRTQNPPCASMCGFKSRPRHQFFHENCSICKLDRHSVAFATGRAPKLPRQSPENGSTRNLAARHSDRTSAPERRTAIAGALQREMLKNGFSNTSLSDLARAAGMTVSHLLYYFPSKEAVLEHLNDAITNHIANDLIASRQKPSAQQINNLVDHYIGGRAVPTAYRKLVLQQMAAATDDAALRNRKKQQAKRVLSYLENLFRVSPRLPGLSAQDAAVLAVSLWMGLTVNSLFLDQLSSSRARELLRSVMLVLAGIEDTTPQKKKGIRAKSRTNRSRRRT